MSTPSSELPRHTVRFEDAIAWQQRGDLARADAVCAELVRLQPQHADAWHLRGLLAFQVGQFARGADFLQRSLAINPNQPAVQANIGTALLQLDRAADALACFERALALQPDNRATLYGRGSALLKLKRFDAALSDFDQVLTQDPAMVMTWCARGQALQQIGRLNEALSSLERAPPDSATLFHRANVLFELNRYEEALAAYDKVGVASVELFNNRGNTLRQLQRHDEALANYERALALDPTSADTLTNRGNVLLDSGKYAAAIDCYDAALKAQPDLPVALENRGLALSMADRPEEAARSYARLLEVAPHYESSLSNYVNVLCNLLNTRCMSCDWQDFERLRVAILDQVDQDKRVHPFPFMALSDSARLQLRVARAFASQWPSATPRAAYRHSRLKVAYLSADFREHVVSYLMAGVFECHDRESVEVIAVSVRPFDNSAMGNRVKAGVDQFLDLHALSDRAIADTLRELEVDILVDLMGFTRGCRPGILASRPAPVQVNYLGYPGTMGAQFIDYIIADEFVIPPESRRHYAEKVLYLPDCFQANDDRCEIAPKPTRQEVGLPDDAFVFCCINNSYKVSPPLFDIWMRLLRQVPNSVLWMLGDAANLRREAAARGIDPGRIVIAAKMPYAHHLGRLGLADLFLDTVPYNAGATASDALRTGVPVLTCAGEAFAARMAGSLLRHVGLPELLTYSLAEYEQKALQLAREPQLLGALRQRLAKPLFDTARFCRQLETAYRNMLA